MPAQLEDPLLPEALDDGQREGQCLAGSRLVLGLDVPAAEDGLVGHVLDGEEGLDALLLQVVDHPAIGQEAL